MAPVTHKSQLSKEIDSPDSFKAQSTISLEVSNESFLLNRMNWKRVINFRKWVEMCSSYNQKERGGGRNKRKEKNSWKKQANEPVAMHKSAKSMIHDIFTIRWR